MSDLTCDIEFMMRYPYLFTVIMTVFIPSITLLTIRLFNVLETVLVRESNKEDD